MMPYIFTILVVLYVLYVPLPWLIGKLFVKRQKRKAIAENTIYLTFDDGPGNRLTSKILSVLDEQGVKASFFVLGRNIAGREDILKSVAEKGHVIASHGFSHLNAWKTMPWNVVSDVKICWESINLILKENRRYIFRPPEGRLNIISLLYLVKNRIPVILWTVNSLDTWPKTLLDVNHASSVISKEKGGIVLFHDFDRITDHRDEYVLESLKAVIKAGKDIGCKFETVDKI